MIKQEHLFPSSLRISDLMMYVLIPIDQISDQQVAAVYSLHYPSVYIIRISVFMLIYLDNIKYDIVVAEDRRTVSLTVLTAS